ncbi:FAD-dependent pyridine nucleotide-disulphide oxidoreductase (plasmid) [Azospirillum sp. B510]|uniref:NAD(P)/FAD-dependent oxidoreductase n=1 Tax=Azospirillum sp. (strain B510) TaxID=137722 RepID=UPI0001C4BBFB|nr:FAD-dependent oxidoreductase [Azospirillum sp. B510]BAI74453.1 FAD-dependent pyridine nucleotide-disulphide oxidoreductase [Azospirillum sp. B510]
MDAGTNAGVVIVGAGQAGGRVALLLAQRGYHGPVTLIGAEPLPPYERPPLSKEMLADPSHPLPVLAPTEEYERLGISLRLGCSVTAIDRGRRRVTMDDGGTLPYDRLVLATGGRPRQLPFALRSLQVLRSIGDVRAIAARAETASSVLVVGGGVIGLEAAATLRKRGLAVTVVEVGSRLLGRNFPEPVAAVIAERHAAEGVVLRTGVRIRKVEEDAGGLHATLSDGSTVTADFAVVGIGITPDTVLAQDCGLVTDDGVVVDADMRSSDPAILAVGDMAAIPGPDGRPMRCETWQNANVTAERAVATILGEAIPAGEASWFWTDQYDLNVQLTGNTMAGGLDNGRVVEQRTAGTGAGGKGRLYLMLAGDRLVGAAAINAGRDMSICRRLVTAGVRLPAALLDSAQFDARAARALLTPSAASARPVDA